MTSGIPPRAEKHRGGGRRPASLAGEAPKPHVGPGLAGFPGAACLHLLPAGELLLQLGFQ
jgi:hypothetical protein